MYVCSLGKTEQLACSFIQLYALHVPLFQHQHPSKYWAIIAQQQPSGAAHTIMYYQEVAGKETLSAAASFSFPCVGAVPSQSTSASTIPTIPDIESPKMDSLFVHVLLLQVSHPFLIQVSTTILPVQELNLRTVLFRPVCSWGSPWAKNWDEGPFNLHFTLAGDEKSRSANAHNSMSTLFPEIWPKFCHLPAPAALCGCTSFIPPAPSAETKGRAAPRCFLQLYSKLGLPWSCKEMVPFVPYTLILWGCRGKELREEEVFYRQQKSSRSCLSKFGSGPELPNLMCDPKL